MTWRRNDDRATIAAVCALIVAVIAAGGAAAMRAAKQQNGPGGGLTRAVLTDKEAFLLGPPELIAGSEAGKIFPSPDGRYVLVSRTRAQDGLPVRITAADLAQDTPPASPPETSVILWDSQTRKASVVWKAGGGALAGQFTMGVLPQAAWLPGTTNVLLTVGTMRGTAGTSEPAAERASLLLFSAATGATRTLLTMNSNPSSREAEPEGFYFQVSRTQPVAAVMGARTGDDGAAIPTVRALRRNGTLGPVVRVPERTFLNGFSRDGTQIYFATFGAYDKETKKRNPTTYSALSVNGTSGTLTPLDKQPQVVAVQGDESEEAVPAPGAGEDAPPIRLVAAPATLTRAQSRQNVRPVWLERADEPAATPPVPAAVTNKPAPAKTTPALLLAAADLEPPRALVTADCDDAPLTTGQTFQQTRSRWPNGTPVLSVNGALLLPDASAVLYRAGGVLYAVPILRMDKAVFLEARRRAQRITIISNAKQLGLGLMMYTQDYDEMYPSGEGINDKVNPYVKNESLFQNFVYTFGGGPMAGIDQPATTIIGYVTGPGGRANIFADGHVKWQDE